MAESIWGSGGSAVPKRKTVYNQSGQSFDVDEGVQADDYQPGVGYSVNSRFNAPPPQPNIPVMQGLANVGQTQANTSQTGAETFNNIQPNVQSPYITKRAPYGPDTTPPVTQPAFEQQALQQLQAKAESDFLNQRAGLSDKSWKDRFGQVSGMVGGGGPLGDVPNPGMAEEEAARNAIFAREKDKIGQIGRGSLDALRGLMSERGMLGGGAEQVGINQILSGQQGQLGDVVREQSIQDLSRAGQISDRNYAGNLTKRGQDIQQRQALLALINAGPIY